MSQSVWMIAVCLNKQHVLHVSTPRCSGRCWFLASGSYCERVARNLVPNSALKTRSSTSIGATTSVDLCGNPNIGLFGQIRAHSSSSRPSPSLDRRCQRETADGPRFTSRAASRLTPKLPPHLPAVHTRGGEGAMPPREGVFGIDGVPLP